MERHFTEKQVSEIIRRAAERQNRPDSSGRVPIGISESELLRVAGELGIDADALQSAMREVGSTTASDTGTLRSFQRVLEREVDGELPEEALAAVMEEFVPLTGIQGSTVTIGRAVNYTAMAAMGQCNVNVAPRQGKTILRVRSNAGLAILPTFLPAMVVSIPLFAVMLAKAHSPAWVVLLTFAALWGGATLAFRGLVRLTNRRILELTDRAAAKLESLRPLWGRLGGVREDVERDEGRVQETQG